MNERINQSFSHLINLVLFFIGYVTVGMLSGKLKHRKVLYKTGNNLQNWSEDKWHIAAKHLKNCLEHNNWSINISFSFLFLEDIWAVFSNMLSRMLLSHMQF